jgi:hypothetical protein
MEDVGQSAKGLFDSAGNGRNFRVRRRRGMDALDRFAELLSHHDLTTGDHGGDARACARRMGLNPASGNGMLQRLRRRLGPQAR